MKTTVRELATIQLTSSLALALYHLQESLLRLLGLSVMLGYLLCQGASPVMIYICTGRRLLRQPQRGSRAARRASGRGSERSPRLTTAPCLHGPQGLRGVLDKVWLSPAHPHFHEGKISARHSADPGGSKRLSMAKTA